MESRISVAGAWAGGSIVTVMLAAGAPPALWLVLVLVLLLTIVVRG